MVEVAPNRQAIADRGKRLEYFTIAWNSLEGLVALIAGGLAGSYEVVVERRDDAWVTWS